MTTLYGVKKVKDKDNKKKGISRILTILAIAGTEIEKARESDR